LEKGVQAAWRRASVLCMGSRKQCTFVLPQTERRAVSTVKKCLGTVFAIAMVLLLTFLTTNDLCLHLGRETRGKHTCWLGIGKPLPAFFRTWAAILGAPQYHSPFQNIQTDEEYFHIVGLVEDGDAPAGDTCPVNGICENGEKAVAIFTDKTASQLNFDDSVLWSPDQNPHANQRWQKFLWHPYRKLADVHLADHICRRWNRRSGHPKLKSVAAVRTWREMTVRNGSLEFGTHRFSIVSHFQCSDHGQSGLASNAKLIFDKMKEVHGATHVTISLFNNVRYPLLVYWVNPETGREIAKGRVREQVRWIQHAEPGHIFRFYWDLPGVPEGSHAEKGLLAHEFTVGQTESKVVIEPKAEWEISVQNHGQYPLLVYWVHHDTGEEIAKGHIHKHSTWDQKAELGHVSLYASVLYCCIISLAHF
jgi:hypothetical protein